MKNKKQKITREALSIKILETLCTTSSNKVFDVIINKQVLDDKIDKIKRSYIEHYENIPNPKLVFHHKIYEEPTVILLHLWSGDFKIEYDMTDFRVSIVYYVDFQRYESYIENEKQLDYILKLIFKYRTEVNINNYNAKIRAKKNKKKKELKILPYKKKLNDKIEEFKKCGFVVNEIYGTFDIKYKSFKTQVSKNQYKDFIDVINMDPVSIKTKADIIYQLCCVSNTLNEYIKKLQNDMYITAN